MPRTILSPAEQWRTLEETASAWGALRNNAHGRGVEPRTVPEAARELQGRILLEHDRFRAWQDRITILDAALPSLGSELDEWRTLYNDLAAQWSRAMKATVIQLPAVRGPVKAAAEGAASLAAPGGALFWLAVIGIGVYAYSQRRKDGPNGGS